MNAKEILTKALNKAAANGSRTARQYLVRMRENPDSDWSPRTVCMIACFSHDFAEAFWGEGEKEKSKILGEGYKLPIESKMFAIIKIPVWQYHLQQMVLFKEPTEYIAKFVDE